MGIASRCCRTDSILMSCGVILLFDSIICPYKQVFIATTWSLPFEIFHVGGGCRAGSTVHVHCGHQHERHVFGVRIIKLIVNRGQWNSSGVAWRNFRDRNFLLWVLFLAKDWLALIHPALFMLYSRWPWLFELLFFKIWTLLHRLVPSSYPFFFGDSIWLFVSQLNIRLAL